MKRTAGVFAALLILATGVNAEWGDCFGWSSSAAAQHACCPKKLNTLGPDTSKNCCVLSQQSHNNGPIEQRVVAQTDTAVRAHSIPVLHAWRPALAGVVAVRTASPPSLIPVPFYVQHRSLLI